MPEPEPVLVALLLPVCEPVADSDGVGDVDMDAASRRSGTVSMMIVHSAPTGKGRAVRPAIHAM